MIPTKVVTENIIKVLVGPDTGYYLTTDVGGKRKRWCGPVSSLRKIKYLAAAWNKVKRCSDCHVYPWFGYAKFCEKHIKLFGLSVVKDEFCEDCLRLGRGHFFGYCIVEGNFFVGYRLAEIITYRGHYRSKAEACEAFQKYWSDFYKLHKDTPYLVELSYDS